MRRFLPDTITGRTLLVLLVGITLSHVVSLALYLSDRDTALRLEGGQHFAERIVTIARLIENAPADRRPALVARASSPLLRVSWTPRSAYRGEKLPVRRMDVLHRSFMANMAKVGHRNFMMGYGGPPAPERAGKSSLAAPADGDGRGRLLKVSLQLADGTWLNFAATVESSQSVWSLRFILSLVVMIAAVILMSAIVVQYLNRPLQVFARAANRLGRDVGAPPLPEFGPREVREAIRAFNDMQSRIRRLVDDRSQMLTAITHDLRTPITLLRLRAEFVTDEDERSKILATLDEMESMVASILAFARDDAESEEARTVDLGALIGSICEDMADAGLDVTFEEAERLTVECRPLAIKRAVANVIGNAMKYGARARVRLTEEQDVISIVVEDDGPGIPEDQLEKVFSPFYRVEGSRNAETGGTGLGLSVARTIMVAHGGDVILENRRSGGLRAILKLPR